MAVESSVFVVLLTRLAGHGLGEGGHMKVTWVSGDIT